jgi:anaerobic glycerol-3-phosphate dehydrogenase
LIALVVGGGFAGLAAAWALSTRGRQVVLTWDGPGASSLYSGALDRSEWGGPPDPRPLSRDAEAFVAALGCWAPPPVVSARLATSAGVLRPARCHDRALLDLEPQRGRRISVVDFGRPGWDAEGLARAWSGSAWARGTRTEFRALPVQAPDPEALRWLPPSDLAERCDDPTWSSALAEQLQPAGDGESPLLLGPWLGLRPQSIARLRELVRRPIGETLSDPGGAAGFRFELARDAWLEGSSVRVLRGEVHSVRRSESGFEVWGSWPSGSESKPIPVNVSEVILALGGVVGGGIRFLSGPGPSGRSFSLSVDTPLGLRLSGREVTLQSGALGADLQLLGLAALEAVGLSVDEQQLAQAPDLYAVGDVVADRPRCALEAIYAGIAAARAVCRVRPSENP